MEYWNILRISLGDGILDGIFCSVRMEDVDGIVMEFDRVRLEYYSFMKYVDGVEY